MEDYIIFMDMLYHGSKDDKDKISFMLCDIQGQGKVFLDDFKKFVFEFLGMYEELTQIKTKIDDLEADIV